MSEPTHIEINGAHVHNLKNISVKIPLHKIVGIAGVSGSGKSSLALGVLYAEGSRRYLESLSTYTRRRMTQAAKASVDEVLYVPASLALHQRPAVPGIRSTFGTGTELLNSLRLMFSRLASHRCPNGHYVGPSLNVAAERELVCPECGERFFAPGAEDLAFNSGGACKECDGTGVVREVDESTLVPDDSLTIDEGAVAPWQTLMWSLMKDIARDKLGVRTDVPFRDLTKKEKESVFYGEAKKYHLLYHNEKTNTAGEMDFTYYNAVYTVQNALSHVKDEKGMKRVEKFLKTAPCSACGGTRLSEAARAPLIGGKSLADVCKFTLADALAWVEAVPASLPKEMQDMAKSICESFTHAAKRLIDLGLGYLTLDRESSTLSTGERQRMQLARAVRNRTTGVLYVLDEPTIGLHPSNIEGVAGVMDDLLADGNSVILVDHDTQILSRAHWIVEMGPGAGSDGGTVLAEGTVRQIEANPKSKIGPFLKEGRKAVVSTSSTAALQENPVVEALETTAAPKNQPEIKFRKADESDIKEILSLMQAAARKMKENGIDQWDDVYPCQSDVEQDIMDGTLFAGEVAQNRKKTIASVYTLNAFCDDEYKSAAWRYQKEKHLVLHRLCVRPEFQGQGLAKKTLHHAEDEARKLGAKSLRLDVFGKNPAALALYKNAGYVQTGEAHWLKGKFYLMEKPLGRIHLETDSIHTVRPLSLDIPRGALVAVAGVSGSGKTTLILESLVPALQALTEQKKMPAHIKKIEADGIEQVKLIDATPIGINVRSTVATYADIHDELRKVYAKTPDAKSRGKKAGDFSYNTGNLRCPVCDGTGAISLDVQFLPDVDIPCPDCRGSRYAKEAYLIKRVPKKSTVIEPASPEPSRRVEITKSAQGVVSMNSTSTNDSSTAAYSLPELMDMSVREAMEACADLPLVYKKLKVLSDLGLGYLTLGEETPSLSGGEAQRLKLAGEMGRAQEGSVFVFDEPTIGLHPLDVQTLLGVFKSLTNSGATVIVIEHDLDVLRASDYIIDMGPDGGESGGRIVASGTVQEIRACKESVTGRYV